MSKTLTIELPDEIFDAITRKAALTGCGVEATTVQILQSQTIGSTHERSDHDRQPARENLKQYAGAITSGDPNGADNDRIDADLCSGDADAIP